MNLCLLLPINKLPCKRKVLVIVLCNHMRLHIDLNQNFMSIHCFLTCQHSSWSYVFSTSDHLGAPLRTLLGKLLKKQRGGVGQRLEKEPSPVVRAGMWDLVWFLHSLVLPPYEQTFRVFAWVFFAFLSIYNLLQYIAIDCFTL